jgi:nucleotide-binding universal stress UspA family protein
VLILKPGQKNIFRNIMATVDVGDDFNNQAGNRVQENLNKKVLEYSFTFSVAELTELHIGSVWNVLEESYLRHSIFSNASDEEINHYIEQAQQESSNKLKSLLKEANDKIGNNTEDYLLPIIHLVKGDPSKEIPSMANVYNVDLIVMGTVARTGVPGFIIGNTAELILDQVRCSVLAIKPDGFKTLVRLN